jgi:hypothetical protein
MPHTLGHSHDLEHLLLITAAAITALLPWCRGLEDLHPVTCPCTA